jgi:glycosyltransferase involved in cell wall biosynthesis
VFAIAGNPIPQDEAVRRASRRRTRLASPFTTKILAYSEYVRSSLIGELGLDGGQVEVLYHPMDVDRLAGAADSARSSRAPGPPARIIMVARLDPIKDHRTVIGALHLLRHSGRDVELRLVGSGELEAELRALADTLGVRDAVHFLGSRSDIPEQLGHCDVFVYGMTRDEGLGVVLVEAMAAGIPIICTDAGPAREVLGDGLAGLLVPKQDAQALADSIANLVDDDVRRRELVTTAIQVCRDRYGHAVIGEQLCRLLGLEARSERGV